MREPAIADKTLKFPEGFLWGAATSAFQVEGHPQEAASRCSDWADWTVVNGKIHDRTTADDACQFYSRYPEYVALSRSLNLNAFRISLNWPVLRSQSSGEFKLDKAAVAYYRQMLELLKREGITTFVTLFHFCLPKWLAEVGGWNNPRTVEEFEKYSKAVAAELGDLVDYWLTLNEPLVYAYQGYVHGIWPPGHRRNYLWAFQAIRNMLEGHARAYAAIHELNAAAQVSYTLHWRPFMARDRYNPLDLVVRYYRDQVFNHIFPLAIERGDLQFPFPLNLEGPIKAISGPIPGLKGTLDYLAINYFTREICEFQYSWPPDIFGVQSKVTRAEVTPLGWEIYPEGLYYLLTEDLAPYRLDRDGNTRAIFITENGMATMFPSDLADGSWSLDDQQRIRYLATHLGAIHQAIQDGANVKGYLHWSLMDNFEWSDGLTARFGLVRVAYPTQATELRESAKLYGQVAGDNALDVKRYLAAVD